MEEGTELGQSRKGPVTAGDILTLIGDGEISAGVRPPSLELKSCCATDIDKRRVLAGWAAALVQRHGRLAPRGTHRNALLPHVVA